MEIFIGMAIVSTFIGAMALTFYAGYKSGQKKHKELTIDHKEAERIKKMQEGMNNILSYDINVAMGRKVE